MNNKNVTWENPSGKWVYGWDSLGIRESDNIYWLPFSLSYIKEEAKNLVLDKSKEIEKKIKEIYKDCSGLDFARWIAKELYPLATSKIFWEGPGGGNPVTNIPKIQILITGLIYKILSISKKEEDKIKRKFFEGVAEELKEINKELEDLKFLSAKYYSEVD